METPNLDKCINVTRRGTSLMRGGAVATSAEKELTRIKALAALEDEAAKLIQTLSCCVEFDQRGDVGRQVNAWLRKHAAATKEDTDGR